MAAERLEVQCCIAGGGPAGMMAGLLLARAGVDVVVLEKHGDFLRDFRGDTIHPSTLEVMHEIGLLDRLLQLPHQKVSSIAALIGSRRIAIADFSHLPVRCRFVAFMPQWDFLNLLAEAGRSNPHFALRMNCEVTGLIEEGGRVAGVRAAAPGGPIEVRAPLVIGADGRHSTVRECAGMHVQQLGAPMDVLWFRLSRRDGDPEESVGRFDAGHIFIIINRGEHWQCGYVIRKGSIEALHARGLDAFRAGVTRLVPFASDRIGEIASWDDVKLLTVQVDRLARWYRPGLLCIGDSAHAMSPVGGVGINLAIQDAVAAANILARPLRDKTLSVEDLRKVQARRTFPMRVTQAMQVAVQNRAVTTTLAHQGELSVPLVLKLFDRFPPLRRLPARLIGMGVRPEHVRTGRTSR
jgi:2-polyprenyl-6-methoxyphenol hydroxylase-like FAD-dependent oxidoreductase